MEDITKNNNIRFTYSKSVPELFRSFAKLIRSIYIAFIEDLTKKMPNIPTDIYWKNDKRGLDYIILDCIELYAKQINNVIRLSFEDLSFTFKKPLNDLKNKNMYPAVTSLYNLQVNIFNKKLHENQDHDIYSEIEYMKYRAKSISPQNVKWFEQLQYLYNTHFYNTLNEIANRIDNKYSNIYDGKLLCEFDSMIEYFDNKDNTFAYDVSFLNKCTFTAVIRNVILQFNCSIHDMYNKVKNAHDNNDVNKAKEYFIKKMSNMMNNLLLVLSRYNRYKKISNIITTSGIIMLISLLHRQLQFNINKNILFGKKLK